MVDHDDLAALQASALRLREAIRRETHGAQGEKTLRRFSAWEVAELILRIPPAALRDGLAADPALPRGETEGPGGQPWFSFDDLTRLREGLRPGGRSLLPPRPQGKRAIRAAVANFKGGAGKSAVALHFAQAAALDGWRVLLIDCDPQATLSHAMGLTEVPEDLTLWGIVARDLARETARMNAAPAGAASGLRPPRREIPPAIRDMGLADRAPEAFHRPTAWPAITMVPSCANAAFVEFATAQYRHLNPDWAFFAALSRWLDDLPDGAFDLVLCDCPPAIGYQSLNAVFAADVLLVPSGPGYWEYDSTTSFLGQLSEALEDLAAGAGAFPTGKTPLPKTFADLRVLLTRLEPGNPLHAAMAQAFARVFGAHLCRNPVEHTRAVEQSGRFLCSVYEIDYRDMTRETWRRARRSFDRAWAEFAETLLRAWESIPDGAGQGGGTADRATDTTSGKGGRAA